MKYSFIASTAIGSLDGETLQTIVDISDRAADILSKKSRIDVQIGAVGRVSVAISEALAVVHKNGTPLRFKDMLTASDFDLMHDVSGILKHINPDTGKLAGFFLPRFAK